MTQHCSSPHSFESATPTIEDGEQPVFRVGVVADTHIPDRVGDLHPMIVPLLKEAGVNHILHAGDISTKRVLDLLQEAAPVTAVRGNRDFFAGPLEMVQQVTFGSCQIALMHGHHGLFSYLWDKWKYWRYGYELNRYLSELVRLSGDAQVIVFGHTHYAEIILHDGKMIFNPGSASFGNRSARLPSIGLLSIYSSGRVEAKIIPLEGYRRIRWGWHKI